MGEVVGIVTREAELGLKQLVEDRVRGDDGQAARRGLVDDLVRRPGAHVVHEQVGAGEELRHTRPRHRPLEPDAVADAERVHELAERLPVLALERRQRRAVDGESRVGRGDGVHDLPQALRRRVAAEREQAQSSVGPVLGAGELAELDPVADRPHLRGAERERAAVDAGDDACAPLRGPQQPAGPPMRVPEHERDSKRSHERRGEDGVDRAHVRDDDPAAQAAQLRRQRMLEAQAATGPRARPEGADARVAGQRVRNGPVREDDHLADSAGERSDLRHRRAERRMCRVDLLRDEDEPHALQGAELRDRPHGLTGHLGDHLEVAVVVAHRDACQLRSGSDEKIELLRLPMPPSSHQHAPDNNRPIPYGTISRQLRKRSHLRYHVVEAAGISRRPEQLHQDRRTHRHLPLNDSRVEVGADRIVAVPVRPGARVGEFHERG